MSYVRKISSNFKVLVINMINACYTKEKYVLEKRRLEGLESNQLINIYRTITFNVTALPLSSSTRIMFKPRSR